MKELTDTIVASASAPINQAIAIIRISGSNAYQLLNKVFDKDISSQKGYTLVLGNIYDLDSNKVDQVVLACYRKPKSFTGEDIIEINCHGGVLITQKIITILLSLGMRLAKNGEFTKRAFLNNKINLIQAEAIHDLIFAENDYSLKTAIASLGTKTTKLINQLADELLAIIANISVNIDYPEYDGVTDITNNSALIATKNFLKQIVLIKKHSKISQMIKNGIDTVIIGKPNVGKSSLLNALLKEDKAIVSHVKGTTRDLVEGKINIGEITLNLIDTAGIRKTTNNIELIGINKTKTAIDKAQLVILVLDGSQILQSQDQALLQLVKHKNYIIAVNKSDLGVKLNLPGSVKISALNNDVFKLIEAIESKIIGDKIKFEQDLILGNARQIGFLEQIETNIRQALTDLKQGIPVDLAVIHLQTAWNIILEIQGSSSKVNLIDEIFKRFCLGK